ncbi:MAG: glycosyltransferase family 2 protein [Capsulimonadales bacterium]|nr:glycosyltransferase family 2 protein [Capsulimonadales bacterium]
MRTPSPVPKLSVTITNYNYERFVGRAIESVLGQTFTDFELIVADNASTDHSREIIEQYARQDPRIRVIANTENKGLVGNLVIAIEAARGEFAVHLDADDWVCAPDAFERQIAMLEQDPEISFVWSPPSLKFEDGGETVIRIYDRDLVRPGAEALEDALKVRIMHSGPLFRMSAFRAFGGYDRNFHHSVDTRLVSDLCTQGKVGYINDALYARYEHSSNLSTVSRHLERIEELVRAVEVACDSPFARQIPHIQQLRRSALRHVLLMTVTNLVFTNRYSEALRALRASVRMRPIETLFQRQMVLLLVRVLIGGSLFSRLQGSRNG